MNSYVPLMKNEVGIYNGPKTTEVGGIPCRAWEVIIGLVL